MGEKKILQPVSQTDAAGGDAADDEDEKMVETMFFDTPFQQWSEYLVTKNQPLCSLAMISHGKMCVLCVSVHTEVSTRARKTIQRTGRPQSLPPYEYVSRQKP